MLPTDLTFPSLSTMLAQIHSHENFLFRSFLNISDYKWLYQFKITHLNMIVPHSVNVNKFLHPFRYSTTDKKL